MKTGSNANVIRPLRGQGTPQEHAVGTLVAIDDDHRPSVTFSGSHGVAVRARVAGEITGTREELIGASVLLVFEDQDPRKPILVGVIRDALGADSEEARDADAEPAVALAPETREVSLDEQRLVFEAQEEVVLKCGKASLVLRKSGEVVIRGANVVSRSTGANRIKGASITLN